MRFSPILLVYFMLGSWSLYSQTISPVCLGTIYLEEQQWNQSYDSVTIPISSFVVNGAQAFPVTVLVSNSSGQILDTFTAVTRDFKFKIPACDLLLEDYNFDVFNELGACRSTCGINGVRGNRLPGQHLTVDCNDSIVNHVSVYQRLFPKQFCSIGLGSFVADWIVSFSSDCVDGNDTARIIYRETEWILDVGRLFCIDTINVLRRPSPIDTIVCRGSNLGTQQILVEESGTYIDTFSDCSCIVEYQVSVIDAPTLQVSQSSDYLCPGSHISFSASAGFDQYLWSNGDTTASTSINTSGTITLKAMTAGGCSLFFEKDVESVAIGSGPELCIVTYDHEISQYLILFDTQQIHGIEKFALQQEIDGVFQIVDTISAGENPVFYQSVSSTPNYRLASIDVCDEFHANDASDHGIYLQSEIDNQGAVVLSWNAYQGISIRQYQIWTIGSGGIDQLIDSVAVDLSYYRYLETREGVLQYYIKAIMVESFTCGSNLLSPDVSDAIHSNTARIQRTRRLSWGRADPTHLFPNPTRGEINMGGSVAPDAVDIYDGFGHRITTVIQPRKIDLSSFASGLYYLRVYQNDRVQLEKVIRL